MARSDVPRSKLVPSIAFSIPKWSISPEHHGNGVGPLVDVLGHALEHVLDGNSISLDSSSMSPARRKPYQVLLVALGDAHHQVDHADVGREAHGAD
jgi:hypothetical protein